MAKGGANCNCKQGQGLIFCLEQTKEHLTREHTCFTSLQTFGYDNRLCCCCMSTGRCTQWTNGSLSSISAIYHLFNHHYQAHLSSLSRFGLCHICTVLCYPLHSHSNRYRPYGTIWAVWLERPQKTHTNQKKGGGHASARISLDPLSSGIRTDPTTLSCA